MPVIDIGYWILATARFFWIGWSEATDVYSHMLQGRAESDETTTYRLEISKRSGKKARGWPYNVRAG